jgi:hypothetical protein
VIFFFSFMYIFFCKWQVPVVFLFLDKKEKKFVISLINILSTMSDFKKEGFFLQPEANTCGTWIRER